tara:strand:- start:2266 stop:2514 length:249 start_codon:yes stop_codon:yes gene_type:complete
MPELCDKCHHTYDVCNCYPEGPLPGDLWWDDASYARYQGDYLEPDYPEYARIWSAHNSALPVLFTYPTREDRREMDPNYICF